MIKYYTICVLLAFVGPCVLCVDNIEETREQKLISTFQVVRFPNDNCVGSNSRNGTCYTSQECSSKSGTSAGSCADGFGVCCTFIIDTCGQTSSENLTVWTQPATVSAGVCSLNICPTEDICSLRLDFTGFAISGPSTLTIAQVRRKLGNVVSDMADTGMLLLGSTYTTNCLTDSFYATSPSPSTTPPVVCGNNAGQHLYVEADVDRCNMLRFHLADTATIAAQVTTTRGVTSLATRTWDMTISQIECTNPVLPPTGCTKYWWGSGVATLTNYNRDATVAAANAHLGMQHERMCIRRERGMCIGCFMAAAADFAVSSLGEGAAEQFVVVGGCCGYVTAEAVEEAGTAADILKDGTHDVTTNKSQFGFDCIIIPGAYMPTTNANGDIIEAQTAAILQQVLTSSPTAATGPTPSGPQICGQGVGIGGGLANLNEMPWDDANGLLHGAGGTAVSVCTRNAPFMLEFMSDDLEGVGQGLEDSEFHSATQAYNQGFSIDHTQLAC